MKRTAALPGKNVRSFAHKALKALGFVNIKPLSTLDHPVPLTATAEQGGFRAAVGPDFPAPPEPTWQGSRASRRIMAEDWDVLFRAIELRLRDTVGERPASAPAPQHDDTAGHIQVVVLECVAAMEQLHAALKHDRS